MVFVLQEHVIQGLNLYIITNLFIYVYLFVNMSESSLVLFPPEPISSGELWKLNK